MRRRATDFRRPVRRRVPDALWWPLCYAVIPFFAYYILSKGNKIESRPALSKIYIVYMGGNPKGMESTELLHTSMVQSVLGRKIAADDLLHSYKSFNAFVARLTKEEAARMKGMDGVVSIIPNRINSLQTSRSWDFLGFPENVHRTNIESNSRWSN